MLAMRWNRERRQRHTRFTCYGESYERFASIGPQPVYDLSFVECGVDRVEVKLLIETIGLYDKGGSDRAGIGKEIRWSFWTQHKLNGDRSLWKTIWPGKRGKGALLHVGEIETFAQTFLCVPLQLQLALVVIIPRSEYQVISANPSRMLDMIFSTEMA